MWKCPQCQSDNLTVAITAHAYLRQYGEDNFETDADGCEHEWDGTSNMSCVDCGHCAAASSFEVEPKDDEK